jgi:aspartate racemase
MKRIGLLGGMSWESSAEYYRLVNEATRDRLGGLHSAECVMYSVDFAAIERLQRRGDWDEAARRLAHLAARVERAGADCLVLCTNTMHRLADDVQSAVAIPLLHIADATAERVNAAGVQTLGLLATRYTMQQDFYRGRLATRHGLNVIVPPEPDLTLVHDVIYDELCQGRVLDGSRVQYRRVIAELEAEGAEGIIYGCTEIDLLVGPDDASVPVFDSTRIHVETAADWALRRDTASR